MRGEGLKHFMKTGRVLQASCIQSTACMVCSIATLASKVACMQALIYSYKPSRCVRLLLQLLPEDDWPALGNTVTCSQDTDLASAENEKVALQWRQQRQRAHLDLPTRLLRLT